MTQKRTLSPNQDAAANPTENIWVQANAGTGKTSVLVQRLLRILFRTENLDDCGILCLTYTNAAAGEMRNRILSALRTWAMAPDDELTELLSGVASNIPPTPDDLAQARQIFFFYIDNPEILKIKTIHGFCEEILRRFPIEAGISPSWSLVSDAPQRALLQDAFAKLINTSNDPRVGDAFTHIVGRVSEHYLDDLLKILSARYKDFFQVENIDNYRKYFIDTARYFLELDTPIETDVSPKKLEKIIELATAEIKNTKKPAAFLTNIINLTQQYINKTIDFEKYKLAYIKKTDGKKSQPVSKRDYLVAEQERVYQIDQRNLATQLFNDTMSIFDLSAAFAKIYRDLKIAHNLLDFEDLILYTCRLFSNPETMGWVLSQLNIKLTHILVDEAQDTSPLQWNILRMLAGDFFTDGDTAKSPHSLFVVGDTKQSIYGFQGADPRAFALSRAEISAQIRQNMRTIHEIPLVQSFRSLPPILRAVDTFFNDETIIRLSGFENNPHACFRNEPGGLVELHSLTSKKNDDKAVNDYIADIADKIQELVSGGDFAPNDIMVLVQNRAPMAPAMVRELKRRNIPVAGSDRIVLPDFPAVRDLLNLVRFCINNADDYSLCCVLKSPIFRLTERDIFSLCKIKNNTPQTTIYDIVRIKMPEIYARLDCIIGWSQTLAPYSFFSRVLSDNDTRASMIAALGDQIIDPLEEFMTICLSYERTQTGTLRHFLKWFITGASEIKRDMDASAGVRVVTVHGSKGLESRVVFLIDTIKTPETDSVLPIPPEMQPPHLRARGQNLPLAWLWSPRADNGMGRAIAADALRQTQIAEYYRLLYVAMTRARDRLYVYGYSSTTPSEIAWHTQLWRVLANESTDSIFRINDDK